MTGIIQGLLASISSAAAVVTDAYFNLVTLLLNTSSTNGAQNNTFLDSSTNNFTITRNGNTTQGTFTPFSQTGWGNYFDGSTAYLTTPTNAALAYGSGDFTFETFSYVTSNASANSRLLGNWSGTWSANFWSLHSNHSSYTGKYAFFVYNYNSGSAMLVSTSNVPLNQWVHIAITRSGSTWRMFINGVLEASQTSSASIDGGSTDDMFIGGTGQAGEYSNGYMSNVRIVKGTAVYTSAFTPPTTPLTAISGTSLLTCQSNRFVDNSASPLTITINGTPSVQAFSPFLPTAAYDTSVVGGSGYFDGSGDYLNFTDSANDLDLGGLVASFEAWVYPTSAASAQHFAYKHGGALSWSASNGIEYAIAFDVNKFYLVYNNGGSPAFINGATTRQPYQWHHVVVATDASNNMALFVNGVREGTATNAITKPTTRTTITIGVNVTGGEPIFGYVSGQRFIKGSGAYDPTQSTITVPTAPPTNVTNTKLLLNYTNAGIFDSAAKNVLETVGNAQVSTTQAKWGTTSMAFDGTGDYLYEPNNINYDFGSGDFTIEFWLKTSQTTSGTALVSKATSGGATNTNWGIFLNLPSANNISFYASDGTTYQISALGGGTANDNNWNHFAVTRSGSSFKAFLNGTQIGSTGTWSGSISSTSRPFYVGDNGGGNYFNGYIDDLRITRYARYTANFTAPTAAFPIQ